MKHVLRFFALILSTGLMFGQFYFFAPPCSESSPNTVTGSASCTEWGYCTQDNLYLEVYAYAYANNCAQYPVDLEAAGTADSTQIYATASFSVGSFSGDTYDGKDCDNHYYSGNTGSYPCVQM